MSTLNSEYNKLMAEVAEFKSDLEKSKVYETIKDKYKGFQILFSPLQYKPDFMFVGINPGAGYYKSTGQLANRLVPENTMEYVYENYALARETKALFKLLGLSNSDLSQAVKTNFYFLATENERDLNEIINLLDVMDFEEKSKDWNNRLIKMIKPKIIICEGKSAYTKVLQHADLNSNWDGDVADTIWNGAHVVGYKRLFSQIKDIDKLTQILSNLII